MKFDKAVKEILLEYPHISFLGDQMYDVDFRIEKFKGNYYGFLNHARNFTVKLKTDRDKQKFKQEIESGKDRFILVLKMAFKEYANETNPLGKFFKDIGL
jgi:hypothetical protein